MNELKFAARQLVRNRGFTLVATLTLAIGIGANTALFTVINSLMLRSLPVKEPGELVQLYIQGRRNRDYNFTFPAFDRLRQGSSTANLFAAGKVNSGRLAVAANQTEFIQSQPVSANFFEVLGVQPVIGRLLQPSDERPGVGEPVAVISYGFWQRRFGGETSVVGKAVTLNEKSVTIIGVAPPRFFGFEVGANPDVWIPLNLVTEMGGSLGEGYQWLFVLGRKAAGVQTEKALAEFAVIYERYRKETAPATPKISAQEARNAAQDRLEVRWAGAGWTSL